MKQSRIFLVSQFLFLTRGGTLGGGLPRAIHLLNTDVRLQVQHLAGVARALVGRVIRGGASEAVQAASGFRLEARPSARSGDAGRPAAAALHVLAAV